MSDGWPDWEGMFEAGEKKAKQMKGRKRQTECVSFSSSSFTSDPGRTNTFKDLLLNFQTIATLSGRGHSVAPMLMISEVSASGSRKFITLNSVPILS